MTNREGLQKVIFDVDLSKGMDEQSRPELLDSKVGTQSIVNMVQDQAGAWVKRPGVSIVSSTEETDLAVGGLRKVIRTPGGTSCVGLNGYLYDHTKVSYVNKLKRKNKVPCYSVNGRFIASSNSNAQYSATGVRIYASASNLQYDVVLFQSGPSSVGSKGVTMVVYNKLTNTEVVRYQAIANGVPGINEYTNFRVAFSSSYLHVWFTAPATFKPLYNFVIYTGSAWPADLSAVTVNTAEADVTGDELADITVDGSGNSWVVCGNKTYRSDDTGATTSCTFDAGGDPLDPVTLHSVQWTSANVISVGVNTSSQFSLQRIDPTAMTENAQWVDTGVTVATGGFFALAAKNDGTFMVIDNGDVTFGTAGSIPNIRAWTADAINDTALTVHISKCYGWRNVSCPWYDSLSDEYMVHLVKADAFNSLSPHVVANLSGAVNVKRRFLSSGTPLSTVLPLEAILEPNNGIQCQTIYQIAPSGSSTFTGVRLRYYEYIQTVEVNEATVGYKYFHSPVVAYQTVARSAAFAAYDIQREDYRGYESALFGGASYISGGAMSMYDSGRVVEQGFADYPFSIVEEGGAGTPSGLYNYVLVYRHINRKGEATYSRTYGPVSITVSSKKVVVSAHAPTVTNKESGNDSDQSVVLDVYRTTAGGTQYYLCGTSQYDVQTPTQAVSFNAWFTLTDDMSDLTLEAQPVFYRQPGVPGTPVDRYPAPASSIICQHKDRLFSTDPYGQRVYYSSFFVDGEAAWHNPAFSFYVHGGTGPITGIASMDGRLVVFKQNAIFLVDGDGPPESGPNGTEYSPPQRIVTEFGCIDHRSIVVVPDGLMFRSSRGFELLNRSLQVMYIGSKVAWSAQDYPYTTGAFMDDSSRVHFICWNGPIETLTTCKVFTFDLQFGCWSVATFNTAYRPGHGLLTDEGPMFVAGSLLCTWSNTTKRDGTETTIVPSSIILAPIKVNGPQGRQRIYEVVVLAKKVGNHAMKLSLDYDYANTFSFTKTWQPSEINTFPLEELNLNPDQQAGKAVQLKIEDLDPTDSVTYPPGNGFELLDVTFEVAAKQYAAKLPAGQKK